MTREEALRIVFEQLGYNEGLMEALDTKRVCENEAQPAQEPLGAEFEKVLFDNLNELYEGETQPAPSSYQSDGKLSYSEELAYQAGFEAGRSFERGCINESN